MLLPLVLLVPSAESNLPLVPIWISSLPLWSYFWMMPSLLPVTQTLLSRSTVQPWMPPGTTLGSPHEVRRLPAGSNFMIAGAAIDVSFSSAVMSRRLVTNTLSCASTHTPPSWPTIHLSGRSFRPGRVDLEPRSGLRKRVRCQRSDTKGDRERRRGVQEKACELHCTLPRCGCHGAGRRLEPGMTVLVPTPKPASPSSARAASATARRPAAWRPAIQRAGVPGRARRLAGRKRRGPRDRAARPRRPWRPWRAP